MGGPRQRVVGCEGGGGDVVLGLPMSAYGGFVWSVFLGSGPAHAEISELGIPLLTATCALYFGGTAVQTGASRIRSARAVRHCRGVSWAGRCCEVERPWPARVLVVGPESVALLSQRGEQVRGWAWSELGGATVDRVEAEGRVWEALVLWSRGEHRLAQLAFPTVGSGFFERMGRSTVEPVRARAVILDRLAQHESVRGTGPA